jgi:hypothetical protein
MADEHGRTNRISHHEACTMKQIASSVAIAAAGFSALFGLYAVFGIDVSEDAVIADVQSQSLWASPCRSSCGHFRPCANYRQMAVRREPRRGGKPENEPYRHPGDVSQN